jgi:hypothetical protein
MIKGGEWEFSHRAFWLWFFCWFDMEMSMFVGIGIGVGGFIGCFL